MEVGTFGLRKEVMVLNRRLMAQGTWQGNKKGTEEVAAHGQALLNPLLV